MKSELGEYSDDLDSSWLLPAVSVDDFFAQDVRHLLIQRRPERRSEIEAALAADRKTIEAAMEFGDELRPWRHRFDPVGPSGQIGVAVVRAGRVIKAWWTGVLC
jgi:hypothetical protein